MNRPMTKQEWLSYIEQTWNAAQKEAWSEQPRRELVGLTRDEVLDIEETAKHLLDFARSIEAKLREKNT